MSADADVEAPGGTAAGRVRGRWALPPERGGHEAPQEVLDMRGDLENAPPPVLDPGVRSSEAEVGGVPCLVLDPPDEPVADLIWYHGGGYRMGLPRMSAAFASALASAASLRVVLPSYRLGPEHPFPAGLHDAAAVHDALAGPGRAVLVGGDSAGGGIAVSFLVACVQSDVEVPKGAIALSPWVDLTVSARTYERNAARDELFGAERAVKARDLYLQGADPRDSLVSPVFANLTGLPRTLLCVGGVEVLLDDTLTLGSALARDGVSVDLHVRAEMQHIWPVLTPSLPESAHVVGLIVDFVCDCLA